MATGGTPPGSGPNQAPSELPPDPPHTDQSPQSLLSNHPSSVNKPYKLNTSSPSPANSVPLQVHVPAGMGGQLPHATRTLPGGLLAQPHYAAAAAAAAQLPQGQAGLMPFPYGGGLMAAAGAPRAGAGMAPLPGGLPGMAGQPIMLPGGGIMRHQRRAMAPVMHHPYQRVAPVQQVSAPPQVPGYPVLPAAAAARALQPQAQTVQTPYGQMLIQASQGPGLQYRVHPAASLQQMQAVQMQAMDPTMAALYAQYSQAAYNPYLQQLQQLQLQHPSAGIASIGGQPMSFGQQPYAAYVSAAREQQPYAAAYAGAREQQAAYDPQKLLNAHYAQMLVPEQCSMSPPAATTGLNGTSSDYEDQNS